MNENNLNFARVKLLIGTQVKGENGKQYTLTKDSWVLCSQERLEE